MGRGKLKQTFDDVSDLYTRWGDIISNFVFETESKSVVGNLVAPYLISFHDFTYS